jgi:hypothetical protein
MESEERVARMLTVLATRRVRRNIFLGGVVAAFMDTASRSRSGRIFNGQRFQSGETCFHLLWAELTNSLSLMTSLQLLKDRDSPLDCLRINTSHAVDFVGWRSRELT